MKQRNLIQGLGVIPVIIKEAEIPHSNVLIIPEAEIADQTTNIDSDLSTVYECCRTPERILAVGFTKETIKRVYSSGCSIPDKLKVTYTYKVVGGRSAGKIQFIGLLLGIEMYDDHFTCIFNVKEQDQR